MASIIKASINLDMIDKSKIYVGKKGKYLPITITINDEVDNYYLGNVKVVWTNGDNVTAAPRTDQPQQAAAPVGPPDDLPF